MTETTLWWWLLGGVLASGVLTALSPCPMMTNIAAISYITRNVEKRGNVLFSGLLYALGRVAAYVFLAVCVLSWTRISGEALVRFLSSNIHFWAGPWLILLGMALGGMFSFSFSLSGNLSQERMTRWVEKLGVWSAFPLGILFALAFCPTSASTFLVMLGMSAEARSVLVFPTIFGLASAFPVLIFAGILAWQSRWLGKTFQLMARIDRVLRTVAGLLFITLGVWFSLVYVWF